MVGRLSAWFADIRITDTQTHGTTAVTLAAHARQGLTRGVVVTCSTDREGQRSKRWNCLARIGILECTSKIAPMLYTHLNFELLTTVSGHRIYVRARKVELSATIKLLSNS